MKYSLRLVLAVLLAMTSFSQPGFAMGERIPTESGDYCKDQAISYIRHKWGPDVEIRRVHVYGVGTSWDLGVETNLCSGTFMFGNFGSDHANCTNPQYGDASQFLNRVYALGGDCERLLPDEERL